MNSAIIIIIINNNNNNNNNYYYYYYHSHIQGSRRLNFDQEFIFPELNSFSCANFKLQFKKDFAGMHAGKPSN